MERREALYPEPTIDTYVRKEGGTAMAEAAMATDVPTTLDADTLAATNMALLRALPRNHTDRPVFEAVLKRPDGERVVYLSAEIEADGSFVGEGTAHYFKRVGKGFGSDPSQVPGPVNATDLFAGTEALVTLGMRAEVSSGSRTPQRKPDSVSTLETFRKKAAGQPGRDHFLGILGVNGLTPKDYQETGGLTVAELNLLQRETGLTES